ncbi:hypothetical protein MMC28_011391 [Mycoblastus sanguinarius]|nr:hypothetical protein [Mycoblastus sanguinarius]
MSAMRHWKVLWNKKASDQATELLLSDLSPRTDPNHTEPTISSLVMKPTRKVLSGWRFSVILYILLGFSIFSLNLGVTIWASTGFPIVKGVATVYEGSCSRTKNSLTWLHLAINVLSTLLLSASNFCMQILCAPTREEVDAAHARRKWLSIGVPSLKNLFYVDRKKSVLWILLGLSSIPLHLLWNSAITNTLSSNDYIYNAVTEDFVSGAPWNNNTAMTQYPDVAQSMSESLGNRSLVSMNVTDCITAYGLSFNSEYGNLLLVYDFTSAEVGNNSLLFQGINNGNSIGGGVGEAGGGDWMCGMLNTCDFGELSRQNATTWNSWNGFDFAGWTHGSNGTQHSFYIGGNVKYCLAEKIDHP